jgi:prepilin-type N-terminal cleavage/methylation domain-containing protein
MKKLSIHRPVVMIKQGFTLIEALIVIVLIGILAGLLVSTFNPNNSKGTILFNNTVQVRDALKRAQLDFPCMPSNAVAALTVLYNTEAAKKPANFACNSPATNWKGPYMDALPVSTTTGSPSFADLGDTSITVQAATMPETSPLGARRAFFVDVSNVSGAVVAEAMRACLNQSTTSLTDTKMVSYNADFSKGNCRATTYSETGVANFQVLIGS